MASPPDQVSSPPFADLPELVSVKRSDPVYNAHGYLTKVPVSAIAPFIEAFTQPGDTVVDMFAGSGMTGIAAAMLGRKALVSDISVLGRHIGTGYMTQVEERAFLAQAKECVEQTEALLDGIYEHPCEACGASAELSRRVWGIVFECRHCESEVPFFKRLEEADWDKTALTCGHCHEAFSTRGSKRIGEVPVLDTVRCDCQKSLTDQPATKPRFGDVAIVEGAPSVPLSSDLQMFKASALGRNGLRETSDFFSPRNLLALKELKSEITNVKDCALKQKLEFAFTAILPRASKRYQWSRKRPLNAANGHYYIAPVFYEWNVFDLFLRKCRAVSRSDAFIADAWKTNGVDPSEGLFEYRNESATHLSIPDKSVQYVFTDPPFGSNIYYSDMNLFQEAWLGKVSDPAQEAVVDRTPGPNQRDMGRYEGLLRDALAEANRILEDDGWLSMNFSNSSGALWAVVQRAIRDSGFVVDPNLLSILDKGQRSVKGLASGFENVVTADLVLTMRKASTEIPEPEAAPQDATTTAVAEALDSEATTPTAVYLSVVRAFLRRNWDVTALDLSDVATELRQRDLEVNRGTGELVTAA